MEFDAFKICFKPCTISQSNFCRHKLKIDGTMANYQCWKGLIPKVDKWNQWFLSSDDSDSNVSEYRGVLALLSRFF